MRTVPRSRTYASIFLRLQRVMLIDSYGLPGFVSKTVCLSDMHVSRSEPADKKQLYVRPTGYCEEQIDRFSLVGHSSFWCGVLHRSSVLVRSRLPFHMERSVYRIAPLLP